MVKNPVSGWRDVNSNDPTQPNYSVLGWFGVNGASFKDGGKFTFKIVWPQKTGANTQIWKQTNNPMAAGEGTVSGYESLGTLTPYSNNRWGGLEYNGGKALLEPPRAAPEHLEQKP